MSKFTTTAFVLCFSIAGFLPATSAYAGNGCKVMLCLAGNWRDISQCVPPVKKAFSDAAKGKGWPSCSQASAGNSASMIKAECPPQYRNPYEVGDGGGVHYTCRFAGAVESRIKGQQWSRTWWNKSGDTVTEWFSLGKNQMKAAGTPIDDQFNRDYADWMKAEEEKLKAKEAAEMYGHGGA